jgi:hypothetical protein
MIDMNELLRRRFEESAASGQERNELERRMVVERLKERARAAFTGGGGSHEKSEVKNDRKRIG